MSNMRHVRQHNPYSPTHPVVRHMHSSMSSAVDGDHSITLPIISKATAAAASASASSSHFDDADTRSDTSCGSLSTMAASIFSYHHCSPWDHRASLLPADPSLPRSEVFPRPSYSEMKWYVNQLRSEVQMSSANALEQFACKFKDYSSTILNNFVKQRPTYCGGVLILPTEQMLNNRGRGIVDGRDRNLHIVAVELGAGECVRYGTKTFCGDLLFLWQKQAQQLQQQQLSASVQSNDSVITLQIGGIPTGTADNQLLYIVYSITGVLPLTLHLNKNHNDDLAHSYLIQVAGGMDVANRVMRCIDRRVLLDETRFIFAASKAQTQRLDTYCSVLKYHDELRFQSRPYQPLTVTIVPEAIGIATASSFHERHPLCSYCEDEMASTFATEEDLDAASATGATAAPAVSSSATTPLSHFFYFMRNCEPLFGKPGAEPIDTHSSVFVPRGLTDNCRGNLSNRMRECWPQRGFLVPRACAKHRDKVAHASVHHNFEEKLIALQKDVRSVRKELLPPKEQQRRN